MKIKIISKLLFVLLIYSCSSKTSIILATDKNVSQSDNLLIKKGISKKKQIYSLQKKTYKNSERKKLLLYIEKMSEEVLKKYSQEKIDETKYNAFANEAKHSVQTAVYMMENEKYSQSENDLIIDYLKQSIKTLNNLLNQ